MNVFVVAILFVLAAIVVSCVLIYFLVYFPTDKQECWVVFWYENYKDKRYYYLKCNTPNLLDETIADAFEEVTQGVGKKKKSLYNTAMVVFPVQGIFGWGRGRNIYMSGSGAAGKIFKKIFPSYV